MAYGSTAIPRQSRTDVRDATLILIMLLATVVPSGSIAQAVPPPFELSGVNCRTPVYASDHLVCADPELRAIDAENAQNSASIGVLALSRESRVETDEAWFRRRGKCAFESDHRACLIDAYRDRALVLFALKSASTDTARLVCGGAWTNRNLRISTGEMGAMRVTEQDRLLAVATPFLRSSTWKPAVAFRKSGATIVFMPFDAIAIRCVVRSL